LIEIEFRIFWGFLVHRALGLVREYKPEVAEKHVLEVYGRLKILSIGYRNR